jgi:hypothetical protein
VRRPLAIAVFLCAVASSSTHAQAQTQTPTPPELAYAKSTSWRLDGVPELAPMEPTIRTVMNRAHVAYSGVDGQQIEGFYPGPAYAYHHIPGWTPFYIYIRDTATDLPMARYYYGAPTQRTVVEEFLRMQYPDGSISATIGPDFKVDKATVVSDEETSTIVAAVEAYDVLPDPAWLRQGIRGQSLIERLNRSMDWVMSERFDPATGLIKRAHTTDWGDVKWESNLNRPTDMDPGDQWTASIYDQAIGYAALRGLVHLNGVAGREADRSRWEAAASELRAATNRALWQPEPRGFYRIHVHLAPDNVVHEDFNEADVIAIGNAAAIYYGLADAERAPRIVAALERARLASGAHKPGLTLYPPYPGWFQVQMDERTYQNGALWDWWAGRQISAEFWSGHWRLAREHLLQLAQDWATHPGQVREWESPWLSRNGADASYVGAAAVVGQAIVEGLYGVDFSGKEVRLTPRLGDMNGSVRVYQPTDDLYAAYIYQATPSRVTLQYGSNSPRALSVRLPVRWRDGSVARLDGRDVLPIAYERVGEEILASVVVPSGVHRIELDRVRNHRPRI